MGTVVCRMDEDTDDLETRCGDRVGMGIRDPGTVGNGYKYMSPCSSLFWIVQAATVINGPLFKQYSTTGITLFVKPRNDEHSK